MPLCFKFEFVCSVRCLIHCAVLLWLTRQMKQEEKAIYWLPGNHWMIILAEWDLACPSRGLAGLYAGRKKSPRQSCWSAGIFRTDLTLEVYDVDMFTRCALRFSRMYREKRQQPRIFREHLSTMIPIVTRSTDYARVIAVTSHCDATRILLLAGLPD
jgi:hypothetical protein